jgi:hypothetical protein
MHCTTATWAHHVARSAAQQIKNEPASVMMSAGSHDTAVVAMAGMAWRVVVKRESGES